MAKVEVKCLEGRVAFTAARGGARIPTDKYIQVTMTPWIDRLINHHGDIELKPEEEPATPVQPKVKPPKQLPVEATETEVEGNK